MGFNLSSSGFDDIASYLRTADKKTLNAVTEVMRSEATPKATEIWREEIKAAGHVKTGQLMASVGAPKEGVVSTPWGAYVYIYPQGKQHKQRNATIAYVLHYGRSGVPGSGFVDKVEQRIADELMPEICEMINNYIFGG